MIRDDFSKQLDSINRDIDLIDEEIEKKQKELEEIVESNNIKKQILDELKKLNQEVS